MKRFRSESSIPAVIRANAISDPDKVAIVDGSKRYSYGQLDEAMMSATRAMMAFGIQPGDRVGIWAPNSVEWLLAALGVLGARAVLLPINNRLRGSEVTDVLRRARAKVVFTVGSFLGEDYPAMLRGAAPDLDVPIVDLAEAAASSVTTNLLTWRSFLQKGEGVPRAEAEKRIESISPTDVAEILFTSGTTGQPKGVVMTNEKNLVCTGEYIRTLGLDDTDVLLLIPPLGLSFGLKFIFLLGIQVRGKVVIQSTFGAEAAMNLIATEGITYLPGPPTLIQEILDSPSRSRYDLSSLKRILLAGTQILPALVARIREERVVEQVFIGYGLSECMTVAMTRADDDPATIAFTVGRVVDGVQIRIVDDQDRELPLGEEGEIIVRSPTVMEGYLDDPEQTARTYTEDGWLRTGDVGRLDERGYLSIIGRRKDMYIVGGFNVYPAEVEKCLTDYPGVAQAAIVPLPDERLGEVGVAFIVPRQGETVGPDAVIAFAKQCLANFKVPRAVFIVDTLPMNASSKVLRNELKIMAKKLYREVQAVPAG